MTLSRKPAFGALAPSFALLLVGASLQLCSCAHPTTELRAHLVLPAGSQQGNRCVLRLYSPATGLPIGELPLSSTNPRTVRATLGGEHQSVNGAVLCGDIEAWFQGKARKGVIDVGELHLEKPRPDDDDMTSAAPIDPCPALPDPEVPFDFAAPGYVERMEAALTCGEQQAMAATRALLDHLGVAADCYDLRYATDGLAGADDTRGVRLTPEAVLLVPRGSCPDTYPLRVDFTRPMVVQWVVDYRRLTRWQKRALRAACRAAEIPDVREWNVSALETRRHVVFEFVPKDLPESNEKYIWLYHGPWVELRKSDLGVTEVH